MRGISPAPPRAAALLLFALLLLPALARAGESELAHAIFVKVNGKTITQEQVLDAVNFIVRREYNDVMPEDEAVLDNVNEAALRDLVRTYLIHDAVDHSTEVNITPERVKRVERSSGMSQELITPTIRMMLLADELFEELMMSEGTPVSQPSPKQVKDFYAENRDEFRTNVQFIVRTIFIPTIGRRPQAYFKAQGEELMATIQAVPLSQRTEAFANAARQYSQDVFAEFGGLLTGGGEERWIPQDFNNKNPDGGDIFPATMVEEIRRLARPGELRLAVSADGVHLLYCEDVRGGRDVPWAEAKRIIEYVLTERARNQRLREWINRVYENSDVRWHDGTAFEKETLTKILLPSERNAMEDAER